MEKVHNFYKIGKKEIGNFCYTGLDINHCNDGIKINQDEYIATIDKIDVAKGSGIKKADPVDDAGRKALRRAVGQSNWAARRSRPDVCFDLMELSMKFQKAQISELQRANKVIERLQSQQSAILFPRLKKPSQIITYSDASYGNLIDRISSGRGHVIFLADDDLKSAPLAWTTNKVKRVVTSTLAAEAHSLHDCVNHAIYLRSMVAEAIQVRPTPTLTTC